LQSDPYSAAVIPGNEPNRAVFSIPYTNRSGSLVRLCIICAILPEEMVELRFIFEV
jgi:hypothetical protein